MTWLVEELRHIKDEQAYGGLDNLIGLHKQTYCYVQVLVPLNVRV